MSENSEKQQKEILIFKVVKLKDFHISDLTYGKYSNYIMKIYLSRREFSELSESIFTFSKLSYPVENPVKTLHSITIKKSTFSKSDHEGAFIALN